MRDQCSGRYMFFSLNFKVTITCLAVLLVDATHDSHWQVDMSW